MVCGEKYSVALCILFIQFPCETVFGIFHFKAKSSQLITDFIACSPVFIGFGFHTLFQQHIYYFAVCLFTCLVIGGFFFQAEISYIKRWNTLFSSSRSSAEIVAFLSRTVLIIRAPSNRWAMTIGEFKSSFMAV